MSPWANQSLTSAKHRGGGRVSFSRAAGCLLLSVLNGIAIVGHTSMAQPPSNPPSSSEDARRIADIEHRLDTVTDALAQTQQTLQESLLEIPKMLRGQLEALHCAFGAGRK